MASRTVYLGIIGGHNGGHELAKLIAEHVYSLAGTKWHLLHASAFF